MLFRTELIIAVKSALQLVVKGREKYSDLNDRLCSMIELFLILREKCAHDDKATSLIHKEWHLNPFIQELIQALLPKKSFGGFRKQFSKEIMVRYRLWFCIILCFLLLCISYISWHIHAVKGTSYEYHIIIF